MSCCCCCCFSFFSEGERERKKERARSANTFLLLSSFSLTLLSLFLSPSLSLITDRGYPRRDSRNISRLRGGESLSLFAKGPAPPSAAAVAAALRRFPSRRLLCRRKQKRGWKPRHSNSARGTHLHPAQGLHQASAEDRSRHRPCLCLGPVSRPGAFSEESEEREEKKKKASLLIFCMKGWKKRTKNTHENGKKLNSRSRSGASRLFPGSCASPWGSGGAALVCPAYLARRRLSW